MKGTKKAARPPVSKKGTRGAAKRPSHAPAKPPGLGAARGLYVEHIPDAASAAYLAEPGMAVRAPDRIAEKLRAEGMPDSVLAFVLRAQALNFQHAADKIAPATPGIDAPTKAIHVGAGDLERWKAEEAAAAVPRDMPEDPPPVLLDALDVINAAELSFEAGSEHGSDPADLLREALLCAREDFAILGDEGGEKPSMAFYRAERRIQLALALHDFRVRHGGDARAARVTRPSADETAGAL